MGRGIRPNSNLCEIFNKFYMIHDSNKKIAYHILSSAHMLNIMLKNYPEDMEFYKKSLNIYVKNMVEFYSVLSLHYSPIEFVDDISFIVRNNWESGFEERIKKINLIKISNPLIAESIFELGDSIVKDYMQENITDEKSLMKIYSGALCSYLVLYDALKT